MGLKRLIQNLEKTPLIYFFTVFFFAVIIVYGSSLFNGFVWDDEEQIVNNTIIQSTSNIPYLFTSSTFNTGGAGLSGWYYKPLMPITFSLINAIFGNFPFGFHLFDLILHFTNTILLFFLLKKLFELQKLSPAKTLSFVLSFVFLVHPANTESVAYISSTQELLYTFFLLIAVLLTILRKKISMKKLIVINFITLLSLLSKESGIVTIPLIIAFIFLFNRRQTALFAISSLITFTFYLILRYPIAKTPVLQHSNIIPIVNASFFQRLQTIPFELFSYLRLFFFPKDLFVAQHVVIKTMSDPRFYLTLPIVLVLIVFLIIFYLKSRSKPFLFFLVWITSSFLLLLNIYPLDMTIAERWLYAPMIGVLGIIGILMAKIKSERIKFLILIYLLVLLPFLSIRTAMRTFDWKDNLSLFSHDVRFSKDSFDVQNNLGVALFRAGDQNRAKKHFQKSIELSPNWWTPYNNLGVIYQREGNLQKTKSLYQKSIEKGNYYLAYENLAKLKYQTEKPKDLLPFIESSLGRLPNNETLNKIAALTYSQLGATDSAKLYAQRAYLINSSQDNYLLLQTIVNRKGP